ncbi:hypothetical protein [Haloarchaeobius sp. DFWS5]|uniref:hypothetical protein n=1 Tax=Haloarchaeobius sp. DFWS5 TaxID=3446114 RepID=UPI003EBD3D9A
MSVLPSLLPLQVEAVGGVLLLVLALVLVYKAIQLAFGIAIKIVVIAVAFLIVMYGLALVGFNPLDLPASTLGSSLALLG